MIRVKSINTVEIAISDRLSPWDAGRGPTIIELSESPAPPQPDNGIFLEGAAYFLMMENTTNYLLQEA